MKCGETQNLALFILHLILGKTTQLKADSLRVDIVNGKEREFFRELFDAQEKLLASNLFELDSNGNTIPRLDKYGNPVLHSKGKLKGTPMWIENEHSFKRKNLNNTPENQYDKLVMFDDYIKETNLLENLEQAGIITLVESKRSLTKEEKRKRRTPTTVGTKLKKQTSRRKTPNEKKRRKRKAAFCRLLYFLLLFRRQVGM